MFGVWPVDVQRQAVTDINMKRFHQLVRVCISVAANILPHVIKHPGNHLKEALNAAPERMLFVHMFSLLWLWIHVGKKKKSYNTWKVLTKNKNVGVDISSSSNSSENPWEDSGIYKVSQGNWLLLEGQSVWDFVFLFFQPCRNRKKKTHGPFSAIEPLGGEWACECGGEEPDSGMNTP